MSAQWNVCSALELCSPARLRPLTADDNSIFRERFRSWLFYFFLLTLMQRRSIELGT